MAGKGRRCGKYFRPVCTGEALYLEGRLGEKDVEKAGELFQKAAEQGNGVCGISPWQAVSGRGGDPKRYGGGCLVADRSGGTGAALCPVHTGMSVSEGEEIPRYMAKAVAWLQQAALQGNEYVQYRLGSLYLLGEDVPQDLEEAIRWLELVC